VTPDGKPWSIKMPFDYGYVVGTEGQDGDEVDVFLGPNKGATHVYIVHQCKTEEDRTYDEDKCMLGFNSANEAKAAYHSAYNNVDLFHSMTMMPIEDFKKKVKTVVGKIHAQQPLPETEEGLSSVPSTIWNPSDIGDGGQIIKNTGGPMKGMGPGSLEVDKYQTKAGAAKEESEQITKTTGKGMDSIMGGGPGSGPHPGDEDETWEQVRARILSKHKPFNKDGSINTTVTKDPEFHHNGVWNVQIGNHLHKLYKDPEMKTWMQETGSNLHWTKDPEAVVNPGTKQEAIKTLVMKHIKKGDLSAGGPGSGRHKELGSPAKEEALAKRRAEELAQREANRKKGYSARGKPIVSAKAKRAMESAHNVATKQHQDLAEANEDVINKHLKGSIKSKNNSPFDIIHTVNGKKHGIEVKALLTQKNDKITQKGDAIARKQAYAKTNKIKGMHTVAVDYRNGTPVVYHKEGVGSFRIGSMTPVKGGFKGLKNYIK